MKITSGFLSLTSVGLACASVLFFVPAESQASTTKPATALFQANAGWGLAASLNVNSIDEGNYWYPKTAGAGATVYVVDSGVSNNEKIFYNSNVTKGYDATNGSVDGSANVDCSGHGTTVASVVAGGETGVAKKATIVPIKVSNCENKEGYENKVIVSGLEWVKNNPPANGTTGIVNLSFGVINDKDYLDEGLEDAVQSLVDAGFFVAVAAGNDSSNEVVYNACDETPARVSGVVTVGAYTYVDGEMRRADFSNSGNCIDVWAPGENVETQADSDGQNFSYTTSGTSVATPYVAGLAGLLVGENSKYNAGELESVIKKYSVEGKLNSNESHPLNSNTSYVKTGRGSVTAQSVDSAPVNLVVQMPFNVPTAPDKIKKVHSNRFWNDAYLSWEAPKNIEDQSQVSYIVSYAKLVDGYVKDEGTQVVTNEPKVEFHDLNTDEYAYQIETVNNGVVGESTGWVHIPVFYACVADFCIY